MTWTPRLKRVFKIGTETCEERGGRVRVIAFIEDPVVFRKVLDHLEQRANPPQPLPYPTREPPLAPSPDRS